MEVLGPNVKWETESNSMDSEDQEPERTSPISGSCLAEQCGAAPPCRDPRKWGGPEL